MRSTSYMADFSLALINRTGAYYICRDLLQEAHEYFDGVRYWRMRREPTNSFIRKLAGRLMLAELQQARAAPGFPWPGPRNPAQPVLYMDPLYVLRADLKPQDIVLCHDVGHVSHPELFDPEVAAIYRQAHEKIARVGPGVVTVSQYTLDAYRRLFGEAPRFLTSCPLYVRRAVRAEGEAPVPGIRTPFLLTVGAFEKRKNHLRMIEAYKRSGLHEKGISYVLCGARGVGAGEIHDAMRQTPGVHALGYVSDDQLRWLLRNAEGMVLASLLEGFGLPPLEAAQEGLVSVVSRDTAQEEAIGGHAILVDPYDTASIAAGMIELVGQAPAARAAMLADARAYAETLSFERFVENFKAILARNDAPNEAA